MALAVVETKGVEKKLAGREGSGEGERRGGYSGGVGADGVGGVEGGDCEEAGAGGGAAQ